MFVSKVKCARITPRKLRLVADPIRGLGVSEAISVLEYSQKKSRITVLKCLKSALYSARNENSSNFNIDDYFIEKIFVDDGPRLKRFIHRAMGRATRVIKRQSHLTIVIKQR